MSDEKSLEDSSRRLFLSSGGSSMHSSVFVSSQKVPLVVPGP
jgi:hypothetical protein